MSASPTIDVGAIIDSEKPHWFTIRLIIVSCLITAFDGFDLNVISYAAPYLSAEFRLSQTDMGNLFGMGFFGTMVGGFLFGYLADRIGRRPTILIAACAFTILSAAFAMAGSFGALMIVRFVSGIAIGGLLPVCWALNIEYVPRSYRATVVTIVMLGYSVGASLGGPLTIWLAPRYGWEGIYYFAAASTAVSTAFLFLYLPESIQFLAGRARRPERVELYLRKVAPGLEIPPGARFVTCEYDPVSSGRIRLAALFTGDLRWITPLLWTAYIASSMAIFFKTAWTPLVLEMVGYTRTEAAAFSSITALGGAIGGLALMRTIDTKGPISIAIMSMLSIPLLVYVGLLDTGYWGFLVLTFVINVAMGGAHYGMHSIAGLFYPSSCRSTGTGWATSVAKIGSIAGPLIGGAILGSAIPVKNIFALLAVCPAVLAIAIFYMNKITRRKSAVPHAEPRLEPAR